MNEFLFFMAAGRLAKPVLGLLAGLLLMSHGAWAVTCTSNASGNWNATATWTGCTGGNGTPANTPGSNDTAIIANGHTVTSNVVVTVGAVTVNSGGTLNNGGFNFTVNGATTISGTRGRPSAGGSDTYIGLVTIASGGVWSNAANTAANFRGGLTHNGTTFSAGSGIQTFSTNAQAIGGSSAIAIPSLTVTGVTLTNNGTLTVATALSGTGGLSNSAAGVLNLGGTATITTLTASAVGNTVNYTGAAQTVKATTYHHLNLSGSGAVTLGTLSTVNGNLSLSGTVTATTGAALSIGGNLNVATGTTFTSGNFTNSVTGTTSVSGTLAHSGVAAKTYIGAVTINAGGVWTNAGNAPVTLRGGLTHNGTTFTAGTGIYTFNTNPQAIGGSSAIAIPRLTVTGVTLSNNGTLTIATALSGTGGLTNSGSNVLSLGGTSAITTLTASAVGNTVNYTGAAQTVKATTYHHLGLSGSGTKTLTGVSTVNGDLTLSGTAATTTATAFSIGGNLTVGTGSTFTSANVTNSVSGTTSVSGTLAHSGVAAKTYVGAVTVNSGGVWTNAGNAPVTLRGGLTHNGATFTSGSGIYTFDTNPQAIGGSSAITISNLTVTGVTLTNSGTLTVATALSGTGGLGNSASATLNIGGTSGITTLTASAAGNTVNYTLAGAQTVKTTSYYSLGASGSGAKSLAGDTTVAGTLTLNTATLAIGANTLTLNGPSIAGTPANLTTTASSSLVFGGSAAGVTVPGSVTALNNLTVNNASGVTLGASPTLSGVLTLASGTISTGANVLTLSASCPGSYSRTSGYVIGNLRLAIPGGSSTCTFHVGDSIGYAPITLAMTGATAGTLTGRADAGDHPDTLVYSSGIEQTKSANHYWTLTAGTLASYTSYSATFQFCASTGACSASEVDASANTANFVVAKKISGSWAMPTIGTRNAYSTQINGITSVAGFGEFAVGEATLCFTDTFSGALGTNWSVGSKSGSFTPAIVSGRLRLTDATTGQATWATLERIFPAEGNKATVEFEHFAYGGSGGDGMAVVFSDASVAPSAGAFGGSLGYAQKSNPGSDCTVAGGCPGFAGGWLGIALDEFGNFSNPTEGRNGGTGQVADSVSIRGSGAGVSGYRYLRGTTSLSTGIDGNNVPPGTVAHRYRMVIDHTDSAHAYVSVERDTTSGAGTAYTMLIAPFDVKDPGYSQGNIPTSFNLSFTGSNGASTNIHEVRNLSICTVQPLTAPSLHHIEIEHNGSACTSGTTPITVKACADANCTALYMGSVTVNLTPSASGAITWAPTEPVTFSGGAISMTLANTTAGTITLGSSLAGTRCFNGSIETCSLVFSACTVDAVEVGAVADTPIFTKLAGTAFNLDVVRRGGNTSVTAIQLVDASSGTCTTYPALTPSTITPTSFTLNGGTTRATVGFTYNNAAANVRVRMTTTGGVLSCSSDNFAIRPTGFTVTSSADNSVPLRAGTDPFSYTATAVYGTTKTSSYNGTPKLNATLISQTLAYLGNVTTATFPAASAGVSTASGFKYDEVGNFSLAQYAVYDDSFAAVDSVKGECTPDFSNTLDVNGKYSCQFGSAAAGPFGRFVPDHFTVVGSVANACAAGAFTYMGQSFTLAQAGNPGELGVVQALNASGGITKNYQGTTHAPGLVSFGAENQDSGVNLVGSLVFTDTLEALTGTWANGTFSLKVPGPTNATTGVTFLRPATPIGPYDDLSIGLTVNANDLIAVPLTGVDFNPAAVGGSPSYKSFTGSPLKMRYGRLRVLNAYGSERLPLSMMWETQYWNGQTFVRNTADACTSLSSGNIALSNYQAPPGAVAPLLSAANLNTVTVGALSGGIGSLVLAPTAFATGSVDLLVNLGSTGSPSNCRSLTNGASTSAAMPYLSGQWCGAANDRNPTARASFGVYRTPLIYRRENY